MSEQKRQNARMSKELKEVLCVFNINLHTEGNDLINLRKDGTITTIQVS